MFQEWDLRASKTLREATVWWESLCEFGFIIQHPSWNPTFQPRCVSWRWGHQWSAEVDFMGESLQSWVCRPRKGRSHLGLGPQGTCACERVNNGGEQLWKDSSSSKVWLRKDPEECNTSMSFPFPTLQTVNFWSQGRAALYHLTALAEAGWASSLPLQPTLYLSRFTCFS